MGNDYSVRTMTKRQVLKALRETAEPGSRVHETQKAEILVACAEDLEAALDAHAKALVRSADASTRLARVGVALTAVLALAALLPYAPGLLRALSGT